MTIGVEQGQFLTEPLAIMDGLASVIALLHPVIDVLSRTPARDMTLISVAAWFGGSSDAFGRDPIWHLATAAQAQAQLARNRERNTTPRAS